MRVRSAKAPVYQITGAQKSLSDDVSYRQRRYAISMGIRTLCFVLAIVVPGPLRFVFLLAALVLPYIAVVFANGGREPASGFPPSAMVEKHRAIEAGKKANQS